MRLAAIELSDRRARMVVGDGQEIVERDEAIPPACEAIGPGDRRRFLSLLEKLRGSALAAGAERLVALATGGLRRIRGIGALQAVLPGRLGFDLIIPSALEERRLAYQGAARPGGGRVAVVHLADRWVDFVVGDGRAILSEETVPLGLGTLERTFEGEVATPGEHAARIVEAISGLSEPAARRMRELAPADLLFAADRESAAAGVVIGVLANLLGADRSRVIHRPLAEGLIACELAVASGEAEAHAAHRDQEIRIADLSPES